ncbi:MAG: ribosome small subunit-dependent GTPase A, partial [Eubacteriales bacterium]
GGLRMMEKGLIMKALSGFYYVRLPEGLVECKVRGKLRRDKISPMVGDWVNCSRQGEKGMVEEILPRRNSFIRPAVANLDALVILCANVNPITEPYLIDRITAIAGNQNVPVILLINKCDLDSGDDLMETYTTAGYHVIRTSAENGVGMEELRQAISGKIVAFTGNSGVGKSSILNKLSENLDIKTGEVSEKLGRGRHTTRHVELYPLDDTTYVADTPGFSSFDTERMDLVLKENLQYAFPDFAPFLGDCQFNDCAHLKEPGCHVLEALERGEISKSRHDSYRRLYEIAKELKPWEIK